MFQDKAGLQYFKEIIGDKEELDAGEPDENDMYDEEKNFLQNITVKYGLICFTSIKKGVHVIVFKVNLTMSNLLYFIKTEPPLDIIGRSAERSSSPHVL